MQAHPKVAVVLLGWNGKKFLELFMPSVVASTYPNLDIVVADNASTDDSVEWLQQHYPTVRVIETGGNHGFANGYNIALSQVEADYYVLLNQDVEVTPGWIEPVIELLENTPNAAAAQPKLRAQLQKDQFEYAGAAGGYMDNYGYMFCRGRIFDTVEPDNGQYDDVQEIFWASGAAMFVKAELYHQLGGLDGDLFAHMEEIDLCWRMKNAGFRIMYCPDSVVYHVGGGSLPQGNPRKTFLNFRNNLAIMVKNQESQVFITVFIRLVLDGIAAVKSLADGKIADMGAIARSHWAFFAWLPALLGKRKAIKQQRQKLYPNQQPNRKGIFIGSIIWQYFAKGKKKWSELPEKLFY